MSSTSPTSYDSFTDARKSLKQILDSAEAGSVISIKRGPRSTVVADRDRFRELLAKATPSRAMVVAEDNAWVIVIPDSPFAAEAQSLDDAIADLIANLRDYASEWQEHFAAAPNHVDNWALVQLVNVSSDDELRAWLLNDQDV
ncbi:MAG: hypothetical protein M9882_00985 [Homoserinimonas sp.]|nr:hypothetical protein [Homoserinimonas sp.]